MEGWQEPRHRRGRDAAQCHLPDIALRLDSGGDVFREKDAVRRDELWRVFLLQYSVQLTRVGLLLCGECFRLGITVFGYTGDARRFCTGRRPGYRVGKPVGQLRACKNRWIS